MTRDPQGLYDKILTQLPDFAKPRLAEFEAAIRGEYTGYTIRWDGSCWVARHSDYPALSAGAMSAVEALNDLQMALMAVQESEVAG